MQRMTVLFLVPFLSIAGGAFVLVWWSHRTTPVVGIVDGRLRSCPHPTNCVCSETGESSPAAIAPLEFVDDPALAWSRARAAIVDAGGRVERETSDYLWATFRTPVLRFVDDVELRLDRGQRIIHLRSASRIGRSDLGKNRRRVEALRARFSAVS